MSGALAAAVLPRGAAARPLLAETASAPGVLFTDVTGPAGLLRAVNVSGSAEEKQFLLEEMGGGAAFYDYDGDGWLDIFLVNGRASTPPCATAGLAATSSTTTATARSRT
jgi:hypothetical protein